MTGKTDELLRDDEDFRIGDIVETIKGAAFWGEIIAFDIDAKSAGCTVLAIAPGFEGTKHVYPLKQLRRRAAQPAVKALINQRPNIGASTAEPSLLEILVKYYTPHFSANEAKRLAGLYVSALASAPADPAPASAEPVAWRYRYKDPRLSTGTNQWTLANSDPGLSRTQAWRDLREIEPLYLAARNEIPPALSAQGWRTMDNAPKGVGGYNWMLLLHGDRDDPTVSVGMRYGDRYFAASTFYVGGPADQRQYAFREAEIVPFGWMPLPAAPTAQGGA